MQSIAAWIKRHPLTAFFVLAYTFSWLPWVLGSLVPASRPFVLYPFESGGPLLAALVVIPITQGRAGLRALGASMLRWRVGWGWYALALGLPLVVALGAAVLNALLGAPVPALGQLGPWYMPFLAFAVRLINPSDGPLGEEPGWRGFALPRLQNGRSPLHASLILGLLVAGWHLPLVFLPGEDLAPALLLATVAVTFVYTWIFNHTGDSAFMTLVTHAAEGTITLGALGFTGADQSRMTVLYTAAWCTAALALLVFDWRFWRGATPASARVRHAAPVPA